MPIVLGYRTDVSTVGRRQLGAQSFVDLVLIHPPWPVTTAVSRRLPYRRTGVSDATTGWAVGMGAGVSRTAQEPAAGGRGGAWQVRVGIDRFEGSVRAPQPQCPEARRRRHAARRPGERRTNVWRSAEDRGHACVAASGRESCPHRLTVDAQPRRVGERTVSVR